MTKKQKTIKKRKKEENRSNKNFAFFEHVINKNNQKS